MQKKLLRDIESISSHVQPVAAIALGQLAYFSKDLYVLDRKPEVMVTPRKGQVLAFNLPTVTICGVTRGWSNSIDGMRQCSFMF